MLAKIFLPEKLFGKRLLSKKIISFSLDEKNVTASILNLDISKTEINNLKIVPLEGGDPSTFNDRATQAIQKLISGIENFEDIIIAIPASSVVFKEIKVPLKNSEKIELILENEVESLLPFPIESAVVDFIITRQAKDEIDSQILVAAIQKNDLEDIVQIYKKAGINPTKITIDLFSLYNLYQNIPEYKSIKNGSAIVDIKPHSTRIAFLINGELKLIRNIPKGFESLIKSISTDLNISINECERLLSSDGIGIENHNLQNQIIEKHLIMFLNDVQFTLNSFAAK